MMVEVKAKHIKGGRPENCYSCPWALSLNEIVSGDYLVGVHHDHIQISKRTGLGYGVYEKINLSKKVRSWIDRFDSGYKVEPIRARLDISYRFLKPEFR